MRRSAADERAPVERASSASTPCWEAACRRTASTCVIGLPGTGKTILAQQYVFANATPERPALYLSTVSEPLEKIIRYGQTLDFFTPQAVGSAVFYEDLGCAS